jgi:pimeloyl-ACP methyl ester carboxylesterase
MKATPILLSLLVGLAGCTYLQTVNQQSSYAQQLGHAPQQRVYKHMLDRDTFFVFGQIEHRDGTDAPLAVIAVSNAYQTGEVVDVGHFSRSDSYYGLNLPEGEYQLFVVSDLNGDGFYDGREVIGGRVLSVNSKDAPDKVLGGCDIDLALPFSPPLATGRLAVQKTGGSIESVIYPKGTIRSLDDPIFSPQMADLGLYEPAAFMEQAPMMFYALEEDQGYKVPVVFVHGIGGSARDFAEMVAHLDRRYYRPWFFHYASGTDLAQLSEMFYSLFLSGSVITLQETPMVIVAHSMGGLIVRDAFNRCTGKKRENKVRVLITIASPLGGHPGARNASRAPVVIPSWRSLNPDRAFIRRLHRQALPPGVEYHLWYTFGDARAIKLGENSDGTVPLSCQLTAEAQNEAKEQFGFNDTHTGVLRDAEMIKRLLRIVETVKPIFPEDHLNVLLTGGYAVELGKGFTPMEAYIVKNIGRYMDALVEGRLKPVDPFQSHFIAACHGEVRPTNPAETAWLKFNKAFPDRAGLR